MVSKGRLFIFFGINTSIANYLMKIVSFEMLTLAVIVLTIGCAIAGPIDPKIIGGFNARDGQFPYQVSLRQINNNAHFCGASIISPQWILTAAHCVPGLAPSSVVAVVGTIYLNSGGLGYGIAQITSHTGYNPQTNVNDIAVLRVNGNIQLGGSISSVALATFSLSGGSVTLSGWGLTSYPSSALPNTLQYINLQAISVAECQNRLPEYPIYNTHQCTISPPGQGSCQGDSGGPLVYGSQQVGLVSWGIPCAQGAPDIFTSVAAYRDWIRSVSGV